jgi:hypothetical protein
MDMVIPFFPKLTNRFYASTIGLLLPYKKTLKIAYNADSTTAQSIRL